jgi:hypothetical protein
MPLANVCHGRAGNQLVSSSLGIKCAATNTCGAQQTCSAPFLLGLSLSHLDDAHALLRHGCGREPPTVAPGIRIYMQS